jgi:hypothetical protein
MSDVSALVHRTEGSFPSYRRNKLIFLLQVLGELGTQASCVVGLAGPRVEALSGLACACSMCLFPVDAARLWAVGESVLCGEANPSQVRGNASPL